MRIIRSMVLIYLQNVNGSTMLYYFSQIYKYICEYTFTFLLINIYYIQILFVTS